MAKKKPATRRKRGDGPRSAQTRKKAARSPRRPKGAAQRTKKPKPASKKVKKKVRSGAKTVAKKSVKKPVKQTKKRPSLTSRIKTLDREILKLINQRAEATTKLIERGANSPQALLDAESDDALLAELVESNPGPLPREAVRSIFREILTGARQQVKRVRVAYLGPQFSFTHLAAMARFGKSADLVPVSTIASVFEEVNRGHCEYGLVPIENSTDGRVVDTLYMFTRLPLRICGEVLMSVHHNLLARCPRSEITEIYSKPQAFSQCRDWLARNMPQAKRIEVASTSTAAQLARDKPGAAAVASRQAAVEYGLDIVAEKIEDNANNVTRFAIIGHDVMEPTRKDRTALLLRIPHKPGALSDALQVFKKANINLTWIESFPLRGPEGGYLFFIDFEGHVKDARVKKALQELERKVVVMNVLGSFPRSEPID